MSAAMATGVIESYMSSGSTGFRHSNFVHVTVVFDKLSPHLRSILDVTCLVIAAAFTHESWGFKAMATGLVVITIWPAQSTYVNGYWLLLAATVDELVTLLQGGKPSYQRAPEERHAKGDFSSSI